MGLILEGSN